MKAKRLMAFALTAAMLVSMTTGCAKANQQKQQEQQAQQTQQGGETATQQPAEPMTNEEVAAQSTYQGGITPVKAGEVEMDAEQYYNGYIVSEPTTLDSTKANDQYSNTVLINVMEPLLRIEEDAEAKNFVAAAGAEEWESNEDGTVWTFHLRDNVWSDGQPVTANDYAYSIKRTLDPNTGSPNSFMLAPIKNATAVTNGEMSVDELGVKVIDDKTLEITLETPTSYFESLACTRVMFPVRQDIVEKYGEAYGAEAANMVYCGPFLLQNWTHNNSITLVKNEDYWDKDRVHLQQVNFTIIADENATLNSFDNNSFDSVGVGKREWIDRFNAKEGVSYVTYVNPAVRFNFYNTKDELFQNANIRKAFTLGINREELSQVIYQGTMEPSYSWVPKNVLCGTAGEFRSLAEEPYKQLKDENPDPKALLLKGMEELGLGDDPSTLKVTMSLGGTDQWMRTYAEYLQQTFKTSLGVNLEIEFNEWPTFNSKIQNGDFQIGYMAWSQDYNDPMDMLAVASIASGALPTGWENAEYEALLEQAKTELDDAKRAELYAQAEKILCYDEAVLCPIVNEKVNNFRYNYLNNMASTPFATCGVKYMYTSGR